MNEREKRRTDDECAGDPRDERVLRMPGKPVVEPRVDDRKDVEGNERGEPDRRGGMNEEPEQRGQQGHVEQNERAASCVLGHPTQDEEQTPLAAMHGVEFVGEEPGDDEAEHEIGNTAHGTGTRQG